MVSATTINYADRGVLGVVAPELIRALHLTVAQYGIVVSAFSWVYVPLQFVAGSVVSRFGSRRSWITSMLIWSACVVLTPLMPVFGLLIIVRVVFGAVESGNFPSLGKIVGQWFPIHERSMAETGVGLGETLGNTLVVPLAATLAAAGLWQWPFFVLGVAAVVWAVLARKFLWNTPEDTPRVSVRECQWIRENRPISAPRVRLPWRVILRNRTVWGTALSLFATAWMIYVTLGFVPLYFHQELHIATLALAGLAVWPWIGWGLGNIVGAQISDRVFRRLGTLRVARSLVGGMGYLGGAVMLFVLANSPSNPTLGITLISATMFFVGTTNAIFCTVAVDVCPEEAGQTTAFTFAWAAGSGIVAPLVVGFSVAATHSFITAFTVSALVAVGGALCAWILVRPDTDVIAIGP